jgi:hypothetical protein
MLIFNLTIHHLWGRVLAKFQEVRAITYKTSILPKGVTDQVAFDMAQTIMQATPTLTHLRNNVLLDSFCPEGFIGIVVPIGTDAFVRSFVAKTCRDIIDDVEKLDSIQD